MHTQEYLSSGAFAQLATKGFYPAVAVIEGEFPTLVCANGHQWGSINAEHGCRTCREYAAHRLAGRPDCEEPGCTTVVGCSDRQWEAGVRKCRLHFQIMKANEWNVGPVGMDDWCAGLAQYSNNRWNGWVVPSFDALAIANIIDHVTSFDDSTHTFEWDGETLVHTEVYGLKPDEVEVHRIEPDEDGLYWIGDGWTWQEVTPRVDLAEFTKDEDMRAWLRQNDIAAETMTPEQVDATEDFSTHYAGGLVVLLYHLSDGRCVKVHDSWGGDSKVVVDTYDPDGDEGGDEGTEYFTLGADAIDRFLSIIDNDTPPEVNP
jgi:hypothetical protein